MLRALEDVPVQFSVIVKIDPEGFSEEDVLPLVDFVNEKVGEATAENLPAQLDFGTAKITLRRYTVEVARAPRIQVVTE